MMLFRQLRLLVPLILLLSLCAWAEKISDIHPVNYVTDLAGVLDPATAARINAVAGDVERKTGAQIAVVTVKSLDGRPIEDYAVDLYKHLGIGHKDDRGTLLLLAPIEHKYRIEVGYGLEPVINDARAGDIGRAMVPYLRQNDYNSATELASGQIALRIADASHVQLDQAPAAVRNQGKGADDEGFPWWVVPLGFIVIPFLIRSITRSSGRGRSRRGGFPWWLGPGGFGGGWGGGGGWGSGGGGWGGSSGGGSFGGFGGGSSGGGGASGSW